MNKGNVIPPLAPPPPPQLALTPCAPRPRALFQRIGRGASQAAVTSTHRADVLRFLPAENRQERPGWDVSRFHGQKRWPVFMSHSTANRTAKTNRHFGRLNISFARLDANTLGQSSSRAVLSVGPQPRLLCGWRGWRPLCAVGKRYLSRPTQSTKQGSVKCMNW